MLACMLSGLLKTQPMGTNDFGDRMISSVVGQSIRHLFTRCDWLDVAIRCSPPSKMLQGTIDSFRMEGRGLVIRKQFEAAEMMFETDAVSIDMAAALSGKVRLRQPTQAIAKVSLSEDAINRAFEADLVRQHLENVDNETLTNLAGGDPVTFRNITMSLQPQQQVVVTANTDLPNHKNLPLQFTATLEVEKRRRILFADPQIDASSWPSETRSLSTTFSRELAVILNRMVDLERFNLDGVMLRVNRLETQGKQLVFSGYAQIEHFPGN